MCSSLQNSCDNVEEAVVTISWANHCFHVFLKYYYSSSIYSIFPLSMELNALNKSVDRFLRKMFWFYQKIFSISGGCDWKAGYYKPNRL